MLPDVVKVEYSIRLLPFQLRQVCSWKWLDNSAQHSAAPIPADAFLLLEV